MRRWVRKALASALALASLGATSPVPQPDSRIVGMRRISEAQYRNSIADIFGPDIRVAGRFEPIVRPVHELIASGARAAAISPTGLENFDAMARVIAAQVFDASHTAQFVPCQPADAKRADDACARAVLAPLGRYLFRRPLSASEQAYYVRLASIASGKAGSFTKGLELSLGAMLVAPDFLYAIERAERDRASPDGWRIDSHSRATRLAMTLWNSTPNEAMLKLAEQGRLTDPAQLSALAGQMVQSPRFEQGVRAFFSDMLLFEKFDELAKDAVIYPVFSPEVAAALPEQVLRTITDHMLTRNGDYRALFTTKRTFITRVLGPLYQVPVRNSKGWEPFEFGADEDRAGLLGTAGFLSLYAHSGRSSPTLRGRAVREVLMCQPVPNPPGNVNFTAVQDVTNKAMPTARIRLNEHALDPECAACHEITDPIGLALERFDGIGSARTTENDAPIDVSGFVDGVYFEGAGGLGKTIAQSPATPECLASRALEYATGRPVWDKTLIQSLNRNFAQNGHTIRALFLQVVTRDEAWRVSRPAAKPVIALGKPAKEPRNGL